MGNQPELRSHARLYLIVFRDGACLCAACGRVCPAPASGRGVSRCPRRTPPEPSGRPQDAEGRWRSRAHRLYAGECRLPNAQPRHLATKVTGWTQVNLQERTFLRSNIRVALHGADPSLSAGRTMQFEQHSGPSTNCFKLRCPGHCHREPWQTSHLIEKRRPPLNSQPFHNKG